MQGGHLPLRGDLISSCGIAVGWRSPVLRQPRTGCLLMPESLKHQQLLGASLRAARSVCRPRIPPATNEWFEVPSRNRTCVLRTGDRTGLLGTYACESNV